MQASITALPPPDQWNDHVLAYLRDMGVDQYRGLTQNSVSKIQDFLFSSVRLGLQHPAYQQLLDVRKSQSRATPLSLLWGGGLWILTRHRLSLFWNP